MSDREALRFALATFYQALEQRDMKALGRLWARDLPVSCIHPGWPPMTNREDILDTWDAIFGNPETWDIRCESHKLQIAGEVGIALCQEWIAGHLMATTNIFARENGRWVLIHHQASPVALEEDDAEADPSDDSDDPGDDWEDDWEQGSGWGDQSSHGGRLN